LRFWSLDFWKFPIPSSGKFRKKIIRPLFWFEYRVGWANAHKVERRKLFALDAAHKISDLKAPPGNQLEALKEDLLGYHSIRVNDQWRIIFKWSSADQGPLEVDVVDYH
jgi:proteic killer suppression protein